jgi:hypothetical protein
LFVSDKFLIFTISAPVFLINYVVEAEFINENDGKIDISVLAIFLTEFDDVDIIKDKNANYKIIGIFKIIKSGENDIERKGK